MFTSLLPPNSDHVMIHLGGNTIAPFAHTLMHSVAHDKLCNGNPI